LDKKINEKIPLYFDKEKREKSGRRRKNNLLKPSHYNGAVQTKR
jgi:hypothetical protein